MTPFAPFWAGLIYGACLATATHSSKLPAWQRLVLMGIGASGVTLRLLTGGAT